MRKQKKQSQDKTVCIRMTRDMAEMIEENAKLARISVSEYVRRCVRGDPIILHQEIPYDCSRLLEIYAPLPEISDQLNQVAKALNAGEKMTNERWCKRQVLFPKKWHLFFLKCGKLFSRVCGILFSQIYGCSI